MKGIALKFNTTVDVLSRLNPQITDPNRILVGQRLVVPSQNIPSGTKVYVVQPADTLSSIARQFGTTKAVLRQLNPQITNPDLIHKGQRILVPANSTTYVVQPGDTLGAIAVRFGTTVSALMKLNPQITNPNLSFPGQVIRIR